MHACALVCFTNIRIKGSESVIVMPNMLCQLTLHVAGLGQIDE